MCHVCLRIHRLEVGTEIAQHPHKVGQDVLELALTRANLLHRVLAFDLAAQHLDHLKIFQIFVIDGADLVEDHRARQEIQQREHFGIDVKAPASSSESLRVQDE